MIVDVWGQVPTARMAREDWMVSLARWTGRDLAAPPETPDDAVAAMDAASVDLMLIAGWSAPRGALITNAEMARAVEAHPARLRGLATADLSKPMEAVRELREVVDGKSVVGVRVLPWLWDLPLNDRRYYPIYAACVDLGVPFCTQIGHTGPLRSSEYGRPIPYLEDVLIDFPELTVVGGHVGFPWVAELVTLTAKFPNFYVDTSAYALHRLPPDFVAYMKGIGRERVMFGSNWPMLTPAQCLQGLDDLGLHEKQKPAFLGGLAEKVFRLTA